MRVLVVAAVLGLVAAVFALPSRTALPQPGDVWINNESGQQIVIDDAGLNSEIVARYETHNANLEETETTDRSIVSNLIVPVANEADSLRQSFSYLGEETVLADPGEVYIMDGEWHGKVPVTVAYVHSVEWLHAKYHPEPETP
ncbi:MAG: hypothetical protein R3284_06435 [Rubricoccaceae bacterium]|nr:hypothetical protein [Rubricoccaceae bacterium]